MEQQEIERIARAAFKELGAPGVELTVAPDTQSGHWRIHVRGDANSPAILKITCGEGSSPQWVRDQIFAQYND